MFPLRELDLSVQVNQLRAVHATLPHIHRQDVSLLLFYVRPRLTGRCGRRRRDVYPPVTPGCRLRCCARRVSHLSPALQSEMGGSDSRRGIIHIDEIDKLARRGAGDGFATYGRDVGGEGVQQALLRLLEGTTVTLQAKPPPITSKSEAKDPSEGWASDASLKSGLEATGRVSDGERGGLLQ